MQDRINRKKVKRHQKSTRQKPTLDDVAKAANVSTATVSRTINTPQAVGAEVRARVEQKIRALGYVRDGKARALASNNSRAIGAIIPTLENAIFATGINALEHKLDEAGYTLLLAVSNYDLEHELSQIREMMEHGVDGILLIGNVHLPEAFELMDQHQQLFAHMWAFDDSNPYPCIGFDNHQAAREVADYLLDLGHQRFAIIAGITTNNDRARLRIQGTVDALATRNLRIKKEFIIEKKYSIAAGRDATRQLLSLPLEQRPTAIICGNDVLAFGCLFECLHSGVKVPEEISITGFDDLPLSEHFLPSLTTVRVPTTEMGHKAADFMLESIHNRSPIKKQRLATELIIRESTAPPLSSAIRNTL